MKPRLVVLVALISVSLCGLGFAQAMVDWHNEASWMKPGQEAVGKASAAAIGIGIENIFNPDTAAYQAEIRVSLTTPKAPSLFDWWSNERMRDLFEAGLLADLTPIWQKHINAGEYTQSMMSNFGFNGKAYAIPKFVQYYAVMYNKGIFDKYNLKPAATWPEFLALCDKIKSLGILPLGLPIGGISWTSMLWFGGLMVGNDPQAYDDLCSGKIKYNDPKVIAVMKIWKDLIDKGYLGGFDYGIDSLVDGFAKNEVAMAYVGDWWISEAKIHAGFENLGVFLLPGTTPKGMKSVIVETRPILVGAKSSHLSDALKLADYLMSVEGSRIHAQALSTNPPNRKASYPGVPPLLKQLSNEVAKGNYVMCVRYWEATAPEIVTEFVEMLVKFIRNTDSMNEVLDQATQMADAYWATRR